MAINKDNIHYLKSLVIGDKGTSSFMKDAVLKDLKEEEMTTPNCSLCRWEKLYSFNTESSECIAQGRKLLSKVYGSYCCRSLYRKKV